MDPAGRRRKGNNEHAGKDGGGGFGSFSRGSQERNRQRDFEAEAAGEL